MFKCSYYYENNNKRICTHPVNEELECKQYSNNNCFYYTELQGEKHDKGKPDITLIPVEALTEVIKVLMFGAAKYGRDNWVKVPDLQNRYKAAMARHTVLKPVDEEKDPESGLHHEAHAVCCLLFMLQDKINKKDVEK
jgi:hypothetical protein